MAIVVKLFTCNVSNSGEREKFEDELAGYIEKNRDLHVKVDYFQSSGTSYTRLTALCCHDHKGPAA